MLFVKAYDWDFNGFIRFENSQKNLSVYDEYFVASVT